ncbi:MAG: hypothetical protein ACE5H8_08810 [Alphaproteobacteria bacterium]
MKIVLDVDKLVENGELTGEQAERLKSLAARETGSLGINVLLSLGVVAIAVGLVALAPSATNAILVGAVLAALGLALIRYRQAQWRLLGAASVMVGALSVAGGLVVLWEGNVVAFLLVAIIVMALGVLARSGLLIAASPLALAAALGSSAGYMEAAYMVIVSEATITIAVFALLALAAFRLSKRFSADYQRLALVYARMSLILVNMGLWVGSLWGDYPGELWMVGAPSDNPAAFLEKYERWRETALFIPDTIFVVLWALALIGVGAWGARRNRRFVVNAAAVFGSIHFYTQWFERLGAEPLPVMVGGLIMVGIAIGLWKYNRLARP